VKEMKEIRICFIRLLIANDLNENLNFSNLENCLGISAKDSINSKMLEESAVSARREHPVV
jgi:hypothetical protein